MKLTFKVERDYFVISSNYNIIPFNVKKYIRQFCIGIIAAIPQEINS